MHHLLMQLRHQVAPFSIILTQCQEATKAFNIKFASRLGKFYSLEVRYFEFRENLHRTKLSICNKCPLTFYHEFVSDVSSSCALTWMISCFFRYFSKSSFDFMDDSHKHFLRVSATRFSTVSLDDFTSSGQFLNTFSRCCSKVLSASSNANCASFTFWRCLSIDLRRYSRS